MIWYSFSSDILFRVIIPTFALFMCVTLVILSQLHLPKLHHIATFLTLQLLPRYDKLFQP